MSPRRGFFFVKKHVPRNLEHVLLGFCHFGSVLGSQEGPFKDFLIFIVGFKSDRLSVHAGPMWHAGMPHRSQHATLVACWVVSRNSGVCGVRA